MKCPVQVPVFGSQLLMQPGRLMGPEAMEVGYWGKSLGLYRPLLLPDCGSNVTSHLMLLPHALPL